jgi:transaldolase
MKQNPLLDLQALGQSIWIDFISRKMISSGELQQLIEADGVSGVTSNPSIFEKAITKGDDYDESIRVLTLEGKTADEIYQSLTVEDIQMVADLLRPTYDQRNGQDGFVSLEVSPKLAHDTQGTIDEARLLWSLVDRPNSMIKVPATREGIPAIRQLTSEGININITLLWRITS